MLHSNLYFSVNAQVGEEITNVANANASEVVKQVEVMNSLNNQGIVNDLGILHLVLNEGDLILKLTFLILVLMSIYSWSVIIYRLIMSFITSRKSKEHVKVLVSNKFNNYREVYTAMRGVSPVKDLIEVSLDTEEKYNYTQGALDSSLSYTDLLQRNLRHSLEKSNNSLDGGLAALATIGATAPFVGLFGTVWGIYRALLAISQSGDASIATIAGPIGEVLIATAFGLVVAIPSVLFYNMFTRRNRVFRRKLDGIAHDLYNSFLALKKK